MQQIHPASAERMSAKINRETADQTTPAASVELSPELWSSALPRLMTQRDLAAYLCKSTAWCERARWAGDGPRFVKLGRHVRYRAEDVMAWIDANSRTSTTEE